MLCSVLVHCPLLLLTALMPIWFSCPSGRGAGLGCFLPVAAVSGQVLRTQAGLLQAGKRAAPTCAPNHCCTAGLPQYRDTLAAPLATYATVKPPCLC